MVADRLLGGPELLRAEIKPGQPLAGRPLAPSVPLLAEQQDVGLDSRVNRAPLSGGLSQERGPLVERVEVAGGQLQVAIEVAESQVGPPGLVALLLGLQEQRRPARSVLDRLEAEQGGHGQNARQNDHRQSPPVDPDFPRWPDPAFSSHP